MFIHSLKKYHNIETTKKFSLLFESTGKHTICNYADDDILEFIANGVLSKDKCPIETITLTRPNTKGNP